MSCSRGPSWYRLVFCASHSQKCSLMNCSQNIQPQGGVVGDVVPTKPSLMGQPGIDVSDQDSGQLTSFSNPPAVKGHRDVILPVLQQHSHPGPQGRASDTNVPHVDCQGREWQLPPEQCCGLCEFRHAKPFGYRRHRERLLHLPMLSVPFDGRQNSCCVPEGACAECQQAFHRLILPGEGVGNEFCTSGCTHEAASSLLLSVWCSWTVLLWGGGALPSQHPAGSWS